MVDDTEVVNVTSKDTHVYEEEDECSYSEHQAGREAQHSDAVPPPHPGRSLLSSQTQELEQAVTVQSQQNPAMLGCSVGNSSVFQSEEGIGEGKVLERSLIPTNRMCLGIEAVPLWRGGQTVLRTAAHAIPASALCGDRVGRMSQLHKQGFGR